MEFVENIIQASPEGLQLTMITSRDGSAELSAIFAIAELLDATETLPSSYELQNISQKELNTMFLSGPEEDPSVA